MRREFRRFEYGAIARSDRAHERREQQLQRIIPRTENQRDAERLWLHPTARGRDEPRCAPAFGLAPTPQIFERATYFRLHKSDLSHVRLIGRFPKISVKCRQ